MRFAALILPLLIPALSPAGAQATTLPSGIAVGARVRVGAPSIDPRPIVGRALSISPDSLVLSEADGAARIQFDAGSVASLEVSGGHNRGRWALVGAGIGALGGMLLGTSAGASADDGGYGLGAVAGFASGIIIGAPVGAIVGALAAPEHWTRMMLPPRVP